MISYLKGKLVERSLTHVIVEAGGIGYWVNIPSSISEKLPPPGEEVTILTHLHVREDEQTLYGFVTEEERELFRMLLGVSKIGPKVALAVLGGVPAPVFKQAVISGNADILASSVRGIGKKTAERLILELKDKVTLIPRLQEEASKVQLEEGDDKIADVSNALLSLGYRQGQVHEALSRTLKHTEPDWTVEQLLKETLKYL